MLNVLIDMPGYEPALTVLRQMPDVHLTVVDQPEEKARPLPLEQISDCQVLFSTFLPENHVAMTHLNWVQISSVGYTQLLDKSLPERGIRATNAQGVFDVPIAEWNIAMMINLARNLPGMLRNQATGTWDRSAGFQSEIRGAVVGIWGYGGIGRETARLAKALGMTVHVLVRHAIAPRTGSYGVPGTGDVTGVLPDKVFFMDDKKAFLQGLDFLIMAIPQTAATEGIVGEAELRQLPAHAFVLNPARGPIIQEAALIRALQEGWVSGAALDTHYHYPMPPEHPLWQLPNVIMTPHISGSSGGPHFLARMYAIFLENLLRFQAGDALFNQLSPEQLSGQ